MCVSPLPSFLLPQQPPLFNPQRLPLHPSHTPHTHASTACCPGQNWEESFYACGGIVFIIDVNDTERWPESKIVLDGLLGQQLLEQCPIVVLGSA